ncbi:hypothetical protein [Cellulophaga sp. L1A9]|uniref:hypothetical protein n=1 Tax=Cellulophaga sp. L1A9 TaxID=2686362 RepID=UPI00131D99D1|nr:hypothetical protein [Cellulophaga sp. L1A9]
MKIKQIIYFILILSGALIMGYGGLFVAKEYALAGGIILLMLGVYKASTSWKKSEPESKDV